MFLSRELGRFFPGQPERRTPRRRIAAPLTHQRSFSIYSEPKAEAEKWFAVKPAHIANVIPLATAAAALPGIDWRRYKEREA